MPQKQKNLGHSLQYLAAKSRDAASLAERRKERDKVNAEELENRRKRAHAEAEERQEEIKRLKSRSLEVLGSDIEKRTEARLRAEYGEGWKTVMDAESERLLVLQRDEEHKNRVLERHEQEVRERRMVRLGGRNY